MRAAHAPLLYPGLSDPALYLYMPQDPPASAAALEESFRARERGGPPGGGERWLNWAANRKSDAVYVGRVEATVKPDRTADIAYIVFAPFQRKGYAREACRALIEHLFEEHGVRTVAASIDVRNEASWRLIESLGLERVALVKGADEFKGAVSDEYRYELAR